ncbi:MAG: fluoride efflux transporter CrcB [Ferruginibacter sp.]
MIRNLLIVFVGGGLGAMLRLLGYFFIPTHNFPLATFVVNLTGSLIIGIIFGINARHAYFSEEMKIFLATGICGGFTTFSAFSAENLGMLQQGKIGLAFFYIISSVTLALLAAWVGFKLAS